MSTNGNGFSKWIWECPVILDNNKKCPGCGKQPMSKYQAGRNGRNHLKRVHDIHDLEANLIKKS